VKYIGMIIGLAMLGYVAQEYVLKPKKEAEQKQKAAEEAVKQAELEIPPPPPEIEEEPPPVLSARQLRKIRASTKDTNPDVRWEAAELLVKSRDPMATRILYDMLRMDGSPQNKIKVIGVLEGRTDDPHVVPAISNALRDTDPAVRLSALRSLGTIGDPRAAAPIGALLSDVDEGVRLEAIRTLNLLEEKRQSLAAERAARNQQKMDTYQSQVKEYQERQMQLQQQAQQQ
jgi:HEAT repeat protein